MAVALLRYDMGDDKRLIAQVTAEELLGESVLEIREQCNLMFNQACYDLGLVTDDVDITEETA